MTNLERIRKEKGLSRQELSDLSGISRNVIRNYEQQERDINKGQLQIVYRLARVLQCEIIDLMQLDLLNADR